MVKKKGGSGSGTKRGRSTAGNTGGGEGSTEAWTASDHAIRKAKQQRKLDGEKLEERQRRTALLTRDSKEKRQQGKIRLHIKHTQRKIDALRKRLEAWDDQEERRIEEERLAKLEKERLEALAPKQKRKRPGPETWKLKGAARPASEVYDFDVRYVDPHIKAHEDAKKKQMRVRNIFSLYKGRFGNENDSNIPQPHCREFLALLMQLGNLCIQSSQLKTARQALLECMELDSQEHPITPARCTLMKLYLEANRPESARRLWERLSPDDPSVWIRYSAALIEYVSWKILAEEGSTEDSAKALVAKAIQTNVFCAYYLAFWDSFQSAMDYVDEIEDATEDQPLEEAIEYCNSEQGVGAWQGTDGALAWIKGIILATLNGKSETNLSVKDLEWRTKLATIKEDYAAKEHIEVEGEDEKEEGEKDVDEEGSHDDSRDDDNGDDESKVDVAMFAGMFETAMEMLEDAGGLKL